MGAGREAGPFPAQPGSAMLRVTFELGKEQAMSVYPAPGAPLGCNAIAAARLKNDKVDAAICGQPLCADLLPEAWIAPPPVRLRLPPARARMPRREHAHVPEQEPDPELPGRPARTRARAWCRHAAAAVRPHDPCPASSASGPYPALLSIRRRSTTVWVSMSFCPGTSKNSVLDPTVTATMPSR